jgi:glycosyltransferase involved in cell wall biosynthesis
LVGLLYRPYRALVPAGMRANLRLGQRLLSAKHQIRSGLVSVLRRSRPRPPLISHEDAPPPPNDAPHALDFVGAAVHHNANAEAVLEAVPQLGDNLVLISVMEEAAVTAWLAQAGARFPYVVSLHSLESQCMADIFRTPARRRAESHWLAAACKEAHAVTLPSQGCCNDLVRHFPVSRHNIRKLWNPVDCAAIRRQSFQLDARAANWRDRTQGIRLVHVGRLDPQKNHDLLLAICAELRRRGRRFSLALVGDGHDRRRIEEHVRSLDLGNEVTFAGEQRNPYPWITAADALLLTSRFEAFALVLVEAMVCGTPVVSVDCSAGPSEILAGGEYGMLVPNNDPAVFANAVEQLIEEPRLARSLS